MHVNSERRGIWHAVVTASAVFALSSPLGAQTVRTVADQVQCARCSVRLERLVAVGSVSDSVLLRTSSFFGIDRTGRVFATGSSVPGTIAVYTPQGQFVRSLGRRGQGPGEYTTPVRVVPDGANLHVCDVGSARVTVLDQQTLSVVRTTIVPRTGGATAADLLIFPGLFVTAAPPNARSGRGSVVVFNDQGMVSDSIGTLHLQDAPENAAGEMRYVRHLAKSGATSFWTLRANKYELEEWDLSGKKLQTLTRSAVWFPPRPSSAESESPFRVPQPPLPYGVRKDEAGRLWTLIMVPKADFKPAATGVTNSISELPNFYETQVEVIDPAIGVVLARSRVPGILKFVDGAFAVASYKPEADGLLTWTIFTPVLDGMR